MTHHQPPGNRQQNNDVRAFGMRENVNWREKGTAGSRSWSSRIYYTIRSTRARSEGRASLLCYCIAPSLLLSLMSRPFQTPTLPLTVCYTRMIHVLLIFVVVVVVVLSAWNGAAAFSAGEY